MKQHTTWSFSAPAEDIDFSRILREAPPECRLLEAVIGPGPSQRTVFVRSRDYIRSAEAGMRLQLSRSPVSDRVPRVNGRRELESSRASLDDWLVFYDPAATLSQASEQLDAVEAHYAARIAVSVRAV